MIALIFHEMLETAQSTFLIRDNNLVDCAWISFEDFSHFCVLNTLNL